MKIKQNNNYKQNPLGLWWGTISRRESLHTYFKLCTYKYKRRHVHTVSNLSLFQSKTAWMRQKAGRAFLLPPSPLRLCLAVPSCRFHTKLPQTDRDRQTDTRRAEADDTRFLVQVGGMWAHGVARDVACSESWVNSIRCLECFVFRAITGVS